MVPDRDQILKYISEGNTEMALQLLLESGNPKAQVLSARFDIEQRDCFDLKKNSVEKWILFINQTNAKILSLLPPRQDKLSKIPQKQINEFLKEGKLLEATQLLQAAGYDEGALMQGQMFTAKKLLSKQAIDAETFDVIHAKIKYGLKEFEFLST